MIFIGGSLLIFFVYKLARNDFYYWLPTCGPGGIFIACLLRFCFSTVPSQSSSPASTKNISPPSSPLKPETNHQSNSSLKEKMTALKFRSSQSTNTSGGASLTTCVCG